MKKKIINGILMVALLAATTTSFVSCKDNDEDVKTDLIAQLNKQAADLRDDYIQADKDLKAEIKNDITKPGSELQQALETWINAKNYATEQWVKEYCEGEDFLRASEFPDTLAKYLKENEDFKNVVNTLWGEDGKSGLVKDVANLYDSCDVYRDSIDQFSKRIAALDERLTKAEKAIEDLQKDFENLITSVTVNATETNILSNSKLFPGLNLQFLGGIYGKAEAECNFPDVDAKELAEGIEKEDIQIGNYVYNKENAAGKVFFTVNPSNITATKMAKINLALVEKLEGNDEVTKTKLFEMGEIVPSKSAITWGTRAESYPATVWEAPVKFTSDPSALGQIEPAKMIKIEQVAEHVKTMVNEIKAAAHDVNRSNYASEAKTTTKAILKEAAQILAELAQTKIPSLPALALNAEWTDNNVGTRSVMSDFSLAATAYKPVSFTWGKGAVKESDVISLDKIDNLATRIVNKIKSVEPNMTKYTVTDITINPIGNISVTATFGSDSKTLTFPATQIDSNIDGIASQLQGNLDMLKNAINDINSILSKGNSAMDKALTAEQRITNFLERYINRVIVSIANNGFYQVLQPILLLDNDGAVNRIVSGATLKAGEVKVIPTTVTNELLAPVYKKYIAVVAGGKVTGKLLTNGDAGFKNQTITLAKGENTIVYAAVDFYGNQIVKRYTVTAE
jgi:hypothetical protein